MSMWIRWFLINPQPPLFYIFDIYFPGKSGLTRLAQTPFWKGKESLRGADEVIFRRFRLAQFFSRTDQISSSE